MEDLNPKPEQALKDIKQIMERSSRFISLSGLSGIAAGTCALVGTWLAAQISGIIMAVMTAVVFFQGMISAGLKSNC